MADGQSKSPRFANGAHVLCSRLYAKLGSPVASLVRLGVVEVEVPRMTREHSKASNFVLAEIG